MRVKASLGHEIALFDCLHWKNTVSATFADSRYNDTFFGVSGKQSRDSRHMYEEYSAGSGVKDVSFSSGLTWPVTDSISVMLAGEYKRLTGPAADSPLVKAGSKNQGAGMLGFVYTFGN